jgi:hypothetical protein
VKVVLAVVIAIVGIVLGFVRAAKDLVSGYAGHSIGTAGNAVSDLDTVLGEFLLALETAIKDLSA